MLRPNKLKCALEAGTPVFGLINSVVAPLLVEMIGYAGYDFVIIDLEHTCMNLETVEHALRAAECAGITALVRVPGPDAQVILRVLDAGAQGVVIPHVSSAEEARLAVSASRYHPLGSRGISGGRTTGFGTLGLKDYFALANTELLVAVMIEDRAGIEAIDSILATPGIDLVIEGAVDLSQSLGVPGEPLHVDVQAALQHVAARSRAAGVQFCAVPRADGQIADWHQQGVNAFLIGDDRGIAFRALKSHLGDWRNKSALPATPGAP